MTGFYVDMLQVKFGRERGGGKGYTDEQMSSVVKKNLCALNRNPGTLCQYTD